MFNTFPVILFLFLLQFSLIAPSNSAVTPVVREQVSNEQTNPVTSPNITSDTGGQKSEEPKPSKKVKENQKGQQGGNPQGNGTTDVLGQEEEGGNPAEAKHGTGEVKEDEKEKETKEGDPKEGNSEEESAKDGAELEGHPPKTPPESDPKGSDTEGTTASPPKGQTNDEGETAASQGNEAGTGEGNVQNEPGGVVVPDYTGNDSQSEAVLGKPRPWIFGGAQIAAILVVGVIAVAGGVVIGRRTGVCCGGRAEGRYVPVEMDSPVSEDVEGWNRGWEDEESWNGEWDEEGKH